MDEVIFGREDQVEVITLNRPGMLNAFNVNMLSALSRKLSELAQDDEVRAVVITGTGRGFCSGADLTGAGGRSDAITPVGMRLSTQLYGSVIRGITELEKPVIGAINGDAVGAGCNFALACDILIAADSARFIEVFVRRGLVADAGGTFFLPRLVGMAKAKELMFTGEAVNAPQALAMGLVSRVVPDDKLMDEAMETARKLAKGPTRAIGMIKSMLNRSYETDLGTALDREAALQGIAVSTKDVMEGVSAFLQKKAPDFKGK
ncbi:MAG: enoyl-CoA hydratase/isomerase family protein [Deltaproteobacteria bacterium]|nr:enoyl-CoA hydratase/isomerase family protein [Deltaproteobacteria bacterium]